MTASQDQTVKFDFRSAEASAAWVEQNLVHTGHLTSGAVARVSQRPASFLEDGATFTSKMFELDIEYARGSKGSRPRTALLKLSDSAFWDLGGPKSEVLFYEFATGTPLPLDIPDYYGGEIDEPGRNTALLIECLRGDFERVDYRGGERVNPRQLKRMVESMARLHAAFWSVGVPDRFERIPNSRAKIDAQIEQFGFYNLVETFLNRAGEFLGARGRHAYERYAGVFVDRLKDYLDEDRPQTIVHGDTHVWNFLIPVDATAPPILLDWAAWNVDNAMSDFANAAVARATEAIVKEHETDIIAAYRASLAESGVGYGDDDFWYDYRYAVTHCLFTPIMLAQLVPGMPDQVWQETFTNVMAAIDKHGCWELLD